jgi:ABC-type uncharacterized transport system substrate-binding protein
MLIAARSSQDFACCWRATSRARSKYVSAFAASDCTDSRAISPDVRLTSASCHLSLVASTIVIASPTQCQADALYVTGDPLFGDNKLAISALALKARLPDMHIFREEVVAGGLLSYGVSFPDLFRRAAELVDKILRGTKPADIPVEQPTKFDLVVNLTTAKALGLTIPQAVLLRADEVIE